MKLIDVHCHLNYSDYGDLDGLIKAANGVGVEKIITVGFDLNSSLEACAFAEKYPCVYFTAGFHPTELKKYRRGDLEEIKELLSRKKCVALGEIGLDYHYPDTDKQLQREVFIAQLELAESLGTPVQIHSRDCAEDMLGILREYAPRLKGGAMLHCYSHSAEIAKELEKLGLYFSFGGTSTYSGSKRTIKAVAAIDCGRIMTETDSPYLSPKSRHGIFPNTPESIPEIAENLAKIKGLSAEEFAETVWTTAHKLFPKLN